MKKIFLLCLLFSALVAKEAYQPYLQLIYKASTLGFGSDIVVSFNQTFASRINFNAISANHHLFYDGNKFHLKGLLQSNGLLFDVHPWQNAFFFSWGAYYSKSNAKVFFKPKSKEITIGDHTYPAREVGDVKTLITLKRRVNPYFGIGFNSVDYNNKWHFTFDIGAIYIGEPKGSVQAKAAKGFEGIQDILDNEAKIEEKTLNQKLKRFKLYPVVSIGIGVKF